jgi:SnoaL-like domain
MQRSGFVAADNRDDTRAETRDDTADVVALWRLQATYADIVTRRAWPELATVFRPDVTVEVDTVSGDPHRLVGPQEFASFVGPATDRFDHFEFVILNTVVDLAGPDDARGRIFMCEIRHESASDEWSTAYGLYQDRYRRVDGAWWFADRRYRSLARNGSNAGIFGLPDGLELLGR